VDWSIQDELARRQLRLENLAKAKAVLEARAVERYEAEQAEYETKVREREEKAKRNKRRMGGNPPLPTSNQAHATRISTIHRSGLADYEEQYR